jgi:hypothetical protein
VAAFGLALLCGWWWIEFGVANRQLSTVELKGVIGGVSGCELFSQEKHGYKCSQNPTMACSLICSPCAGYSNNQTLCRLKKCWGCAAGGNSDQLRECIVGTEEQVCVTFGDQPQQVVCGNEESKNCLFDSSDNRCYCDPPLFDSGVSCARKDCADL